MFQEIESVNKLPSHGEGNMISPLQRYVSKNSTEMKVNINGVKWVI